jgi:dCTP deaminase
VTVLSGQSIRRRSGLLTPFVDEKTPHPGTGMTFGLGPAGYDVRVAEEISIWPGQFVLASTVEKFRMHDDLIAFVHDKSTLARRGIALQNTVIEPGWTGFLTLEITNHGRERVYLPVGSPIAQIVFHLLDEAAERPYEGRYQNQEPGPQGARSLTGEERSI